MFSMLAIVLFAAILVTVAVVCVMFFSVAFGGPPAVTAGATRASWQPPLDDDDTLVCWATRMAASLTTKRLSLGRSRTTATELAQEIYTGANEALEQLREVEARCPERCHEMIGATAPEVLAVADSVNAQLDKTELARIRRVAKTNVMQTRAMDRQEFISANVTCPLLTDGGTCAVYALRPLSCRMGCPGLGSEDSPEQQRRVSSSSLVSGIGQGLSQSLADVGVDASRYELNSALLVALDEPDASARWASGEPIFAECKEACVQLS